MPLDGREQDSYADILRSVAQREPEISTLEETSAYSRRIADRARPPASVRPNACADSDETWQIDNR